MITELAKKFQYKNHRCLVLDHTVDKYEKEFGFEPYYCGYVRLNEGSKFVGTKYDDIPIECHGGLTYGRYPDGTWAPDEYMEEGEYWIGFDCNHARDKREHCNLEYVIGECMSIVDQLVELERQDVHGEAYGTSSMG